ncbi:MAG TPA: haloacid dehalogenase type II [Burkholderiaceae bacterium]|nr:haloacid dehalogenase type II [Burkholderiaceae bacterium]
MQHVKAYCFDVFGTVVNWREGVARDARTFFEKYGATHCDAHEFADRWRSLYQPAMQACRSGARPFVRLDILHRENLETVLNEYGLDVPAIAEADLTELNRAWHRLDPWPDVVEGLTRLKQRHIIAPASNGNIAIMVDIAKRAGLPWDAILGAEVTQAYKPAPDAYTRMTEVLDLQPREVCMVAAHNDDLEAAQACGLSTAFVARPSEHGPGQTTNLEPSGQWDVIASDFIDLARRAG